MIEREALPMARADLHVHSSYSRVNGNMPFLRSRDCYSSPLALYQTAKRRGMDIVTITDHDSIDGCLELLEKLPGATDIILGEEVSCRFKDVDIDVHLGVYGMTEALHRDLQRARDNVFEAIELLHKSGVFFALNHLLHFYRGQVGLDEYFRLLSLVPAIEVRNGTMLPVHNRLIEQLLARRAAAGHPHAVVAGSDAHTLRRVGRTWTSAPGRTAAEFLESLRAGLGTAGGDHGGPAAVAADTYGVVGRYAASVFGFGPRDHSGWHRVVCGLCVAASVPIQFLPALIPVMKKNAERRAVNNVMAALSALPASALPLWLQQPPL
jgi:predicted metal-dependent phosphoesterase TrpH